MEATLDIKNEVINYIKNADDRFINIVNALVQVDKKSQFDKITYTQEEYNLMLDNSKNTAHSAPLENPEDIVNFINSI